MIVNELDKTAGVRPSVVRSYNRIARRNMDTDELRPSSRARFLETNSSAAGES